MADNEQVVNGIVMPPLYNQRAGQMWDIISAHVDFAGKRVVDLGCGHGDLVFRTAAAGAKHSTGYDIDQSIIEDCKARKNTINPPIYSVYFHCRNIEKMAISSGYPGADIFICCSVLPYISHAGTLVDMMAHSAHLSIIECQYAGDGPGTFSDDNAMKWWLMQQSNFRDRGWSTVTAIGKTHVVEREKWRTIWKCER